MTSKAAKAKGAERKQRMDTSSLMEQILSKDNLNAAYLQVVRNNPALGDNNINHNINGRNVWLDDPPNLEGRICIFGHFGNY